MAMAPDASRLLVVAGGVAANGAIRAALAEAAAARGLRAWWRRRCGLCADNAVMVAWAGIERLRLGLSDGLDAAPRPRWPLEELAGSVRGDGHVHGMNKPLSQPRIEHLGIRELPRIART